MIDESLISCKVKDDSSRSIEHNSLFNIMLEELLQYVKHSFSMFKKQLNALRVSGTKLKGSSDLFLFLNVGDNVRRTLDKFDNSSESTNIQVFEGILLIHLLFLVVL